MNELLQSLRDRLDALPRERRYDAVLRLVEPRLPALAEWAESIDKESEEAAGLTAAGLLEDGPGMIRQWAAGQTKGSKKLRRMWEVAFSLHGITFENYHQGAEEECGTAEMLALVVACAIQEEKGDAQFAFDYFEGLAFNDFPHLVEVVYRVALASQGINSFLSETTDALDSSVLEGIESQLKRILDEELS